MNDEQYFGARARRERAAASMAASAETARIHRVIAEAYEARAAASRRATDSSVPMREGPSLAEGQARQFSESARPAGAGSPMPLLRN